MDLEYDMKFEEMKKYIPFLENMIKRLESNSSSSANPRQAQLDKIRSLRDLLLDKKKRMKMENLLKCEQVLVNLYAKVEQRGDTLPGIEPASEVMTPNAKSDLNLARSKLKTVADKSHVPDTLPEIARASETEVVCVPGSKEPALFQRRPNKSSLSPTKHSSSDKSPQKSSSKRNYTRVLLSPERSNRDWSASKEPASDQPLFSRRSPPRQSRRYSPSHHKRERKKSSKQESHSRKPKDLNITLKVPEESLNSLNTKDILSRIINCSDGDVDITTLRELRTQILGELKQTGANEDISDLILKSYKNKKRRNKKDDVEEGELSDSESEAIESIYGNLVVVEKDKGKDTSSNHNKLDQDKVPRKIQICLVINSDKEEDTSSTSNKNGGEKQKICDITDFEMFDDGVGSKNTDPPSSVKDKGGVSSLKTKKLTSPSEANHNKSQEIITIDDVDTEREQNVTKELSCGVIDMNNFDLQGDSNNSKTQEVSAVSKTDSTPFKANFYKPLVEPAEATNANNKNKSFEESVDIGVPISKSVDKQGIQVENTTDKSELEKHTSLQKSETGKDTDVSNQVSKIMDSMKNKFATGNIVTEPQKSSPDTVTTDKDQEIPLLNEPTVKPATKDVVSEIDILQALKNEILSETIAIPCAEVSTPALHQPKITKVSNVQELPKKRITIENYKQKSVKPNKTSLFVNDPSIALSKEESRKQSLKLTEKEVERFNLISKIALNDSSDDDDNYETIKSPDGIDFAPKSPDIDFTKDVSVSPPVIIPVDPVKTTIVSSKTDVDMRKMPNMSPTPLVPFGLTTEPRKNDIPEPRNPVKTDPKWPAPPVDPRVRRDKDALLPTPLMGFPNATPTRTPNMTPSRTPTRVQNIQSNTKSFEMTPSRPFEMDEVVQKHVYAPMFPTQENTGDRTPIWEPPEPSPVNKSVWEAPGKVPMPDRDPTSARKWDDRDPRSSYSHRDDGQRSRYGDSQYESSNNRSRNDRFSSREDYTRQDGLRPPSFYGRSECPATPTPSFGRDAPATPSHYFGRSEGSMTPSHPFGRSEVPLTPSHPFGRSEAPLTPSHPFGRSEPPLTPSHPFGRTDSPSTPSHPFGRSEAPSTPIHPFGRSEAPTTPSHPFGRSEAPMTPSHPFGRSDYSYNNQTSKYGKQQDPRLNRSYDNDSSSRSDRASYNDRYTYIRNDPRNSSREQKEERNDKKPYTPDQSYSREHLSRREHSVGHSLPKDNERDGHYSKNTKQGPNNSRSYADVGSRRTAHREESIGRSMPDQRSRASSVGRTFGKPQSNKLSVESHAGRAFTIDTSVNSTFQKLIDSHRSNDSSSFDIRRQRASSVGRSLTRESSIGRMLPNNFSHHTEQNSSRSKFIRAQSVGRDLSRAQSVGRDLNKSEKSFNDIKAEFERYRRTENTFRSESTIPSRTNENISNRDPRRRDSYDKQQDSNQDPRRRDNNDKQQDSNRDPRRRDSYDKLQDKNRDPRRRDSYDKQQDRTHGNKTNAKETNVPAKKFNCRDPRQRKEQQRLQSRFDDRNDKNRSNSRDRHSYGISSDTVIKSPVINLVKNYKIPKIKRAPEEKPEEVAPVEVVPVKVDAKETSARQKIEKHTKSKCVTVTNKVEKVSKPEKKTVADKISKKEVRDDKSKITVEKTEKRLTRQSGRKNEINKSMNESEDEEIGVKTRKFKKVIYHSDSDGNGDDIKVTSKIESPKKLPVLKNKDESTHSNENNVTEEPKLNEQKTSGEKDKELEENQEALDSSFGLDDIDLFSDNIITDPVLDNINALIADLDNDLDAPKGGSACNDLFNEISIENMLEKITTSPTKPETCKTFQSPDITTIKKDIFDSLKESASSDPTENDKSVIATEDNAEKKENSNLTNIDQLKDKKAKTEETPNTTCLDEGRIVDSIEKKYDLPEPNKAQTEVISRPDDTNDPEAVVSTSVNEDETPNKDISADCVKLDGRSTPDSTNDAEVVTKNSSDAERKPDSTAEKQCEMNSDISSTHDTVDKVSKETNEVNEPATQIESIGNLLSMLQDKSKIKELLNMLGGQSSENEKIKKKLEKLSEIVSDEEDLNEVNVGVETEKGKTLSENKVEIETEKNDNEQESKSENTATEDSVDINKLADSKESHQVKQTENVQDKNNFMPENDEEPQSPSPVKNMPGKVLKRFKTRKMKKGKVNRPSEGKRVTRSEAAVLQFKPGPSKKKPSRELKQLQESIKEMFMSEDILNASGIRMCRLAKMVDDKKSSQNDGVSSIDVSEPVVVLEKVKHIDVKDGNTKEKPLRKKPGPKPKVKSDVISPNEKKVIEAEKPLAKYKPGPKSKTRIIQEDKDPYDFETDSLNDSKASDKALDNSSESDDESLASSKSYESSELLVELKKKPKRKRKFWQAGVIKPKHKKRKIETKRAESPPSEPAPETERKISIPDHNCFTDKKYCFSKHLSEYSCRLCESTHSAADIVFHYKKRHPHSEIPLSRMSPEIAKEAIEQCEEINFQAISKIPTEKYTCRFCYKEFAKKKASLEAFFWHVVSMHTGEYKQLCSECINEKRCPFNLDIPPPPKDIKGQLIGFICGKCNFTQISLENLKTHVIVRHNDEQTAVYTINFAVMTKKTINSLAKRCVENQPRVTRSSRSNQSLTEPSDDRSDITESEPELAKVGKKPGAPVVDSPNFSFKSKINFETDEYGSDISNIANTDDTAVKIERDDEEDNQQDTQFDEPDDTPSGDDEDVRTEKSDTIQAASDDVMDYPHFKIRYTDTGNKEYVCCINGTDNHYKTGLLISLKKHVQFKHSENWDGYCFVCKVIVTPQGQHKFSECLLHFLDKHIDDFPVYEKGAKTVKPLESPEPPVRSSTPKTYINVRPLADLLVKSFEAPLEKPVETPLDTPIEALVKTPEALPVIENVVSLLPSTVEPPRPSPTYPVTRKEDEPPKEYNYEEAQAEVMSKKHRVVLDVMMAPAKLVQVFKCAGRFCSFTTYSAESALVHASTHQRVGGTNALLCSYCDFDSSGNAIDLVSHVFKSHGSCQFVCGLCFYRAAASQLVGAHIARVHQVTPGQGAVLKAANAPPRRDVTVGHLTREVAVPLYICKQNDREGACSFRTVTHTKFWEHLTQRHPEATGFNCYICALVSDNATGLVLHLKTHGLKLYHCTSCVFGADTEQELLAHCSAKHPAKPPLAYIRTICGMSGNGSFKILPLVELKKAALPSDEVAADKITENPVREAERSIELEKLIGHLSVLEEPAASPAPTAPAAPTDDSARVTEIPDRLSTEIDNIEPNPLEGPTLDPMATLIPVPSLVPMEASTSVPPITPPPPVDQDLSKQLTPVLKEEPKDTTPEKVCSDDVICLDSDDEDSKQGIISLSDDETANTSQPGVSPELKQLLTDKKITNLLKCDKCSMICSTIGGFKKHLISCYAKGTELKCAHCGHPVETIDALLTHYSQSHGLPTRYSCGLCQRSEVTLSAVKRHVKQSHNVNKLVVTTSSANLGEIIVTGKPGPTKASWVARRKPSAGAPVTPHQTPLRSLGNRQQHLELQPVAQTAPVNPVPHLETNEKHFDKMVNLASSSAAVRAADRPAREPALLLPPAAAARYPRFVPERQRLACGARGCAYISLDEGMLRRHWETLHPGTTDYHCVHCPPHQHLDKSKPLTASRIIGHLKMHDTRLYACSVCPYYHYKRQVFGKASRGEPSQRQRGRGPGRHRPASPAGPAAAAPTMDLKPWQCGLCEFKSMLRPEVVDHCSKLHQSKMQYKCAYCPFRTSMPENVTKHQTSSHPNREQEIFYFYYREGSMPDAADGTLHWQKQRQKIGLGPTQEVKAEIADTTIQAMGTILPQIRPPAAPANVNLNLVKQEVDPDSNSVLETVEDLCKKFGEFCEPNGLNYRCSLCKVVVEDSKLAMQSHLFEELQYRKWGCRLCSYKAFHQTGLKEHMWTEHRQNQEPIELPVDVNVEAWVSKLLDYQEDLIKKNRDKLAQQKIQVERVSAPAPSRTVEMPNTSAKKLTVEELEKAFGSLGAASNMMFVCPKCKFQAKEEVAMQDHLELELTRIRWCCSNCPNNFTTYHEAQFHCKSTHAGQAARPVEAPRDPSVRAAWVSAVLSTQRLSFKTSAAAPILEQTTNLQPDNESNDSEENSLLVIRYEENVPTPEEETLRRKRAASTAPDSDDENLVIDETQKRGKKTDCPHCTFTTKYKQIMSAHILRHYNLKPFTCPYCEFNSNKVGVLQHIASKHSDKRAFANRTEKPLGPPTILDLSKPQKKLMAPSKKVDDTVCLTCEKVFSDSEAKLHVHGKDVPKFGKKGEVVVKCCECFLLLPDVVSMQQHNTADHPSTPINYAYYKLLHDTRDFVLCSHCNQRFPRLIDLKSHHNAVHSSLKLMYKNSPYIPYAKTENTGSETNCLKRKADATEHTSASSLKRVAKKSTTKLPCSQSIAKKSTTKLPFYVDSDSESEEEEYSYYGTKPSAWENFANVTTLMPFYNTMVPFTLKKLREIISIDPKVVVKDVKK
ncbi:hypothetical protein MSG28_005611 [Choristoneura fumiferana]|uniref:Uncharacterized protein n=1 Tax=Choristoneura fumiferana TaxID=7141 RepID=A0ACC0L006_CHOFU|nr:hypothetical protein MSG28_005611 [Choristoneura fumiferana]